MYVVATRFRFAFSYVYVYALRFRVFSRRVIVGAKPPCCPPEATRGGVCGGVPGGLELPLGAVLEAPVGLEFGFFKRIGCKGGWLAYLDRLLVDFPLQLGCQNKSKMFPMLRSIFAGFLIDVGIQLPYFRSKSELAG